MIADHTVHLADGQGGEVAFDVLAKVEDADYQWTAEAVLRRRPDGALFYAEDSGCSCNGFGEYLTIADLRPIFRVRDAYPLTRDRERLKRSYKAGEVEWR